MSVLPHFVLRSPQLFYAFALLVFFWSFGLDYYEITSQTTELSDVDGSRLLMLRALFHAAREAMYVFGTGVWLQVSLAIWARLAPAGKAEAAE